jgi:hypothetical protein
MVTMEQLLSTATADIIVMRALLVPTSKLAQLVNTTLQVTQAGRVLPVKLEVIATKLCKYLAKLVSSVIILHLPQH